jgi:hypothetical protein
VYLLNLLTYSDKIVYIDLIQVHFVHIYLKDLIELLHIHRMSWKKVTKLQEVVHQVMLSEKCCIKFPIHDGYRGYP